MQGLENILQKKNLWKCEGSSMNGKEKEMAGGVGEPGSTLEVRKSLNCIKNKILVQQDFILERQ